MSADLTPESLAELRRLAEAATPGPWVSGDPDFGSRNAQCIVSISARAMGRDIQGPNLRPALFDVEYIAAANPAAALALLDAAAERDEIAQRLSMLLWDLTGGKLSKSNYPVSVMVQEVEQHLSECHESDLRAERDALAELWRLREAVPALLAERDALAARLAAVRDIVRDVATDAGDDRGTYGETYHAGMVTAAARVRQALAIDAPTIDGRADA